MAKIDDIRRQNARDLAKQAGGPANFARKVGMADSRVSQLIGEKYVRNIGGKAAGSIEDAFGMEPGWLDTDHSRPANATPQVGAIEKGPLPLKVSLAYVTDEELGILTSFREANEMGRDLIVEASIAAPRDEKKLQKIPKIAV